MNTIIVVNRLIETSTTTHGEWVLDGKHFAWSLEDAVRERLGDDGAWYWRPEFKVPKATAIPAGFYRIGVTPSARFKRRLPEVFGVPDFTAIRAHGANDHDDVEGCVGVGAEQDVSTSRIWNCAGVLDRLVAYIEEKERHGQVFLDIGSGPGPRHRPL